MDAIAFDVDSTLAQIEGIDELGTLLGIKDEVASVTLATMEGRMPLADAYGARMQKMQPSRALFDRLGKIYTRNITPDAKEVIEALHYLEKAVFMVSGGFWPAIKHLATHLNVDLNHLHAVPVHFKADGSFQEVDMSHPLTANFGKLHVIAKIKETYPKVALIGDGANDLEALPVVDLFVGFGGVHVRTHVKERAPVYLQAPTLAPFLLLALTHHEQKKLRASRFSELMMRADAYQNAISYL